MNHLYHADPARVVAAALAGKEVSFPPEIEPEVRELLRESGASGDKVKIEHFESLGRMKLIPALNPTAGALKEEIEMNKIKRDGTDGIGEMLAANGMMAVIVAILDFFPLVWLALWLNDFEPIPLSGTQVLTGFIGWLVVSYLLALPFTIVFWIKESSAATKRVQSSS